MKVGYWFINWSGDGIRTRNPQLGNLIPGSLPINTFSIFPKVFALASFALIAISCPICTLVWDICGTSNHRD